MARNSDHFSLGAPMASDTLFVYKITPNQVNTSTGTDNPVTLNLGVYNPKRNGFVRCSSIMFGISIGNTENSLTGDPSDVEGQSSQSNWKIEKRRYDKSPLIFEVWPTGGTIGLNPGEAISFELTGININDVAGPAAIQIAEVTDKTRQAQQLVNKAAPGLQIIQFQAEPPSIQPGGKTTLSWETTGASRCTIDELKNSLCSPPGSPPYLSPPDPGLGLEPNGQMTVCPLETTLYTLTAYESGYRQQQIGVTVGQAQIIDFWYEPYQPSIDCAVPHVTLSWEVENAGTLTLSWEPGNQDGTDVTGLDYLIVNPTVDTQYTLLADGSPPAKPQSFTIEIDQAEIKSFTATPARVFPDQPATLAWETKHACACSIDQGVGPVPPGQSSIEVTPQTTTAYTLTANGLDSHPTLKASVAVAPSGWHIATPTGPTASIGLVFKDKLWLIETIHGHVSSSSDGVNWTPAPHAPFSDLFGCSGVVFDDGNGEKMWVMGGMGGAQPVNYIWSSADGVEWTQVQPESIWSPRAYFGCLAFQNKLWVMGGMNSFTSSLGDVWSSTDGVNWTQVTDSAPWGERGAAACAVYNPAQPAGIDQMWICGGGSKLGIAGGAGYQDAWYTTDGVKWKQAPTPPWSARMQSGLVMFKKKLWLLGGNASGTFDTDMWVMDADMNWTQSSYSLPYYNVSPSNPPPAVAFDWRIWLATSPSAPNHRDKIYAFTP